MMSGPLLCLPLMRKPMGGHLVCFSWSNQLQTSGGGAWTVFPPKLLETWGFSRERLQAGGNPIATCEAAMVSLALLHRAPHIKNTRVVFFVDNSSALHCLVKGSSKDWYIDRAVALTHLIAAMFQLDIHFEFVESGANWADSISRELSMDTFSRNNGFAIEDANIPMELYQVSYPKLIASLNNTLGLMGEECIG